MTPVELRHPSASDAPDVLSLVRASGVLDVNSAYAYAATLEHFADTSVVAVGEDLAGFVTGYRLPARPDTLFVWQVGVDHRYRGQGLATAMLGWLLERPTTAPVRFLETTVTPSNAASRRLFTRLAERLSCDCSVRPGFPAALLGDGHEPEDRFRVGPLDRSR